MSEPLIKWNAFTCPLTQPRPSETTPKAPTPQALPPAPILNPYPGKLRANSLSLFRGWGTGKHEVSGFEVSRSWPKSQLSLCSLRRAAGPFEVPCPSVKCTWQAAMTRTSGGLNRIMEVVYRAQPLGHRRFSAKVNSLLSVCPSVLPSFLPGENNKLQTPPCTPPCSSLTM